MKITVFTPTYNRGYIIENLYRSLQRQTFCDFEWIVIDDGSNDNTEVLFDTWQKESNSFSITYKKVENGGKHRAINKGVQTAIGELFFIVDSDDYLSDNALEKIVEVEHTIPHDEKHLFCGVCGLKAFSKDKIVGTTFEGQFLDITCLDREKNSISGDKSEVFYTEVMKKYPFPEFEGENFVTECVVWDKMAWDGLKLRFFNDIVYFCDYLPDGLTHQGDQLYEKNPKGWWLYLYQSILFGKIKKYDIYKEILSYYQGCRRRFSQKQIADTMHINRSTLALVVFTNKVFEKTKQIINSIVIRKIKTGRGISKNT